VSRLEIIRRIFGEARRRPPHEREDYLADACDDDDALRDEIRDLLGREPDADRWFETAMIGQARSAGVAPSAFADPERIGPYRILRRLGEGGMGVVYLAEQVEPVRREVAIKVIRVGMHTERVMARFLAERQALALLDHDGIARLLDAGADEEGRPYFVMERVEGETLIAYCERNHLPLDARLDLLARIAEVVQYAHQRGVLHRDLKPANILVRDATGRPAIKVIDFGIARLLDDDAPGKTLLTEAGEFVGTPEYMSPEQLDPERTADTRSDVYSLGVLLYQLVTGRPPRRVTSSSLAAIASHLQDLSRTDPPSLSRKLGELTPEEQTSLVEGHGTSWGRLVRRAKGDLDWIALTATATDPERRYGSASALADDLRAFLDDRPVSAAPPGASYRMGKFVRRHRVPVVAAGLLMLSLLLGTTSTTWQAVRATREVERLEAFQAFLIDDFLRAPTPTHAGRDVRVSELLDHAAAEAGTRFADDPEALARVRQTLGLTYQDLGLVEPSEASLRAAVAIWTDLGREEERLATEEELARTLVYRRRHAEATAIMDEVVERRRERDGPRARSTLAAESQWAGSFEPDRYAEAESALTRVLDLQIEEVGLESEDVVTTLSHLAFAIGFHSDGRMRADSLLARAHDLSARVHGEDHVTTLQLAGARAENLFNEGHHADEALALMEAVYPRFVTVFGERHHDTLALRFQRANAYEETGDLDHAVDELHAIEALSGEALGEDHALHYLATFALGTLLGAQGEWAAADSVVDRTLVLIRTHHPDNRDHLAFCLARKSDFSHRLGRPDSAAVQFEEARALMTEVYGETAWYTQGLIRREARHLARAGRYDEGEALLRESRATLLAADGPASHGVSLTVHDLLGLLVVAGRVDHAEAELLDYERLLEGHDDADEYVDGARRRLLDRLEAHGHDEAAARLRARIGDGTPAGG